MGSAGRRSRRTAGRLVMVGLAVLCAAAAAASLLLESQGLEQALRDARGQAVASVDDVITPVVARRSAFRAFSVSESEDLRARIDEGIHDPDVTRVRLWSTGGGLLFSTGDRAGSREPAPAQGRRAGRGGRFSWRSLCSRWPGASAPAMKAQPGSRDRAPGAPRWSLPPRSRT